MQGVGFRLTTCRIAGRYTVLGYVQNLTDGRVQVVAEGLGTELDKFLSELCQRMEHLIREVEVSVSVATGEFQVFEIRS